MKHAAIAAALILAIFGCAENRTEEVVPGVFRVYVEGPRSDMIDILQDEADRACNRAGFSDYTLRRISTWNGQGCIQDEGLAGYAHCVNPPAEEPIL